LNYTSTTSYAAGGTISGTTLTLAAADASNPGLVSTGIQTFAGAKTFSNTTASSSTTTGALTVGGGVGIAGAVYAGSIQNTPVGSTTASTGSFTTLIASGTSTLTTLTTTGLATLASAIITGNETVGGTLGVTGATTLSSTSAHGGAATFSSTVNVTGATTLTSLTATGAATISNTTNSTSSSTGALIVRGGVGIANNLTVGGTIEIDGGSPAAGKVLTSDATGLASWTYGGGTTSIQTGAYTILLTDKYVFYSNSATAAATFTLPAATGNGGKEIIIKNKSAYTLTIQRSGSETIFQESSSGNNAATSIALGIESANNWVKLVSDGTQWNVFRALF